MLFISFHIHRAFSGASQQEELKDNYPAASSAAMAASQAEQRFAKMIAGNENASMPCSIILCSMPFILTIFKDTIL